MRAPNTYRGGDVRQVSVRQTYPAWMYLLCGFAVLIVVQGALRKWVFPGLATPLYVAKDIVLLGSFLLFVNQHGFRLPTALRKTFLPVLWGGLAAVVTLQAFNLNVPSAAVGIFGIRSYLLYSASLFLVPPALQYVRRPVRLVTFIASAVVIPVLALGIYQFTMPPGHWINQYVAVEAQVNAVQGLARITGTFSYIQAMRPFLIFSLGFGSGVLIAGLRRGKRWYQVLGAATLGLSLVVAPMNGSRGIIFGFLLAVPFILWVALKQGRRLALVVGICTLGLAGFYFGSQTDTTEQAWGLVESRVERAAEDEGNVGRVESMLRDPIEQLTVGGVLGYGAGSTQPAASALSSEGRLRVSGVSYEEELGRVIIELGIVGALLFLSLKVWVLWMVWSGLRGARTAWEDIICITAFVVALQHLYVDKIVFNHVGGAIYWLCAGAAAWVWSRHQNRPGQKTVSPSAQSRPT